MRMRLFVCVTESTRTLYPMLTWDYCALLFVTGAGQIIASGSGDPEDISSFQSSRQPTWQGRVLAIVQPIPTHPAGAITMSVSAPGMPPATVTITTQ